MFFVVHLVVTLSTRAENRAFQRVNLYKVAEVSLEIKPSERASNQEGKQVVYAKKHLCSQNVGWPLLSQRLKGTNAAIHLHRTLDKTARLQPSQLRAILEKFQPPLSLSWRASSFHKNCLFSYQTHVSME